MQALRRPAWLHAQPYDRERYKQLRRAAARIMAEHTGLDVQSVETLFAAQTGYATPKLDVRGAVFRDGRLVLVREAADADRWTLPGGWADVNESPANRCQGGPRGIRLPRYVSSSLPPCWDRPGTDPPYAFHIWKLFFLCEITGGEARVGPETNAVAFFAEDALPADLSISRGLAPQLRRMFEHMRQPALPTEFDSI